MVGTPCREEAPGLAPRWPLHFKASGVRFLGIDIRDSPATAEAFMSDFRITYPSLNDPSDNLALDFRDTVPPAEDPGNHTGDFTQWPDHRAG